MEQVLTVMSNRDHISLEYLNFNFFLSIKTDSEELEKKTLKTCFFSKKKLYKRF